MSSLLHHARQYHAEQNGNSVTRLSTTQLAEFKLRYTREANQPVPQLNDVVDLTDAPAPVAPASVHAQVVEHKPLSQEDALAQAKAVIASSPIFEHESDESDEAMDYDAPDLDEIKMQESTDANAHSVSAEDVEICQLVEEQAALKRTLALMQQKNVLRARNEDLRKKIEDLQN